MKSHQINLIGLKAIIVASKNKTLEGVTGRIVDETKNLITIDAQEKIKKVLKKEVKLKVYTKSGPVMIDGVELVGRPEERLKKKAKVRPRW